MSVFIKGVLNVLCWIDQKVRTNLSFAWNISDYLSWRFLKKLECKLSKNQKWCKAMFILYENKIWLLAQHLDNHLQLQNKYLSLFKIFGIDKTYLAYLEDRVLINYKGIQKYGTQIRLGDNNFHYLHQIIGICEVGELSSIDIKALNQRRAKMDLDSIEIYADELQKINGIFLKFEI